MLSLLQEKSQKEEKDRKAALDELTSGGFGSPSLTAASGSGSGKRQVQSLIKLSKTAQDNATADFARGVYAAGIPFYAVDNVHFRRGIRSVRLWRFHISPHLFLLPHATVLI